MHLFNILKSNIYDPEYYRSLLTRPFSYTFKYFLALIASIALLYTVILSFVFIPQFIPAAKAVISSVENLYPADLVVTVKDGVVTTNSDKPIIIPIPEGDKVLSLANQAGFANLVVIDPASSSTLEDYRRYKTAVLLTRDAVITTEQKGKITIQPLEKGMTATIDKAKIDKFAGFAGKMLSILSPLIVLFAFVGIFLFGLALLVPMFIYALVLWLLFAIFKQKIGYWKSYQIGLHAATLPIILRALLVPIAPDLAFLPFFTLALIVLVVVFNLMSNPQAEGEVANINQA